MYGKWQLAQGDVDLQDWCYTPNRYPEPVCNNDKCTCVDFVVVVAQFRVCTVLPL